VTGVVHEHIQPANLLLDEGEGARHIVFAHHVGGDGQIPAPGFAGVVVEHLHQVRDLLRRPSVDEHGGPIVAEDLGDARPRVACGTRDQNALAVEHVGPCFRWEIRQRI
jgi:hypothetical protein